MLLDVRYPEPSLLKFQLSLWRRISFLCRFFSVAFLLDARHKLDK